MALTPAYQNIQIAEHIQISAANTSLDGTGTLVTLFAVPAKSRGASIEQIVLNRPSATTGTALDLNLFIDDGTNIRYLDSIHLALDAKAQTIKFYDISTMTLSLEAGQTLKAAITVAQAVNCYVSGGVY
jgi:hypothetical protein